MTRRREFLQYHRGTIGAVLMLGLALAVSARTGDRYTGSQAARDWAYQRQVDYRQDSAIQALRDFLGID